MFIRKKNMYEYANLGTEKTVLGWFEKQYTPSG